MSIGIKAVSTTYAANASSKCVIIAPVKVADIISNNSHGILFFHVSNTPVLMYVLSLGVIAAIFSISSVVSSSIMSKISSIVIIPTNLFSESTTGKLL